MKIIIFTFAGGNKYSFNSFFSKDLQTIVLEYAGRGARIAEPLLSNLDAVIADLYPKLKKEIATKEPYIIYGHSMGSMVAYQICRKIEQQGLPLPAKLIINGVKGPQYTKEKVLSNLPDAEFWEEITKLGGIPKEIGNEPELIDFFAPILKADYKCVEGYAYDETAEKINIPMDVFYGSEEDITEEEISGWNEVTTKKVTIKKLTGNHFFMFDHTEFFTTYFKNQTTRHVRHI
ncbi:thioesterase II family protein [Kordia jejudonensis]|uniref:thioesterase II family protein n=1 Tax=Kordia jejudonensis TaxID=1348245 RepID=UPI00062939B1|nr:thioesterase domain-containing protein [Kordia jejudonensis]